MAQLLSLCLVFIMVNVSHLQLTTDSDRVYGGTTSCSCSPNVIVNSSPCTNITKKCPDEFIPFNDHCYYFGAIRQMHSVAKRICHQIDAALVTIETYMEDFFLAKQLEDLSTRYSDAKGTKGYFIGAAKKSGHWIWETSNNRLSETYNRWHPGQPNDGAEHCVLMWKEFAPFWGWADYSCTFKGGFICEKSAA